MGAVFDQVALTAIHADVAFFERTGNSNPRRRVLYVSSDIFRQLRDDDTGRLFCYRTLNGDPGEGIEICGFELLVVSNKSKHLHAVVE